MAIDISQAPYYDDYDKGKDYVGILAVAGRAAQSREFTQSGTMTRDFLGRLGDAIFKNGQIISGCELILRDKRVTVQPGTIYLNGLVREVREAVDISILGTGDEAIGVTIEESIVSELQDVSLRCPAAGTEAYGTEGAHRLKQTVKFVRNDPDATTLWKLQDGELLNEVNNSGDDTMTVITDVMARRTYDENGNYKIWGLDLIERNEVKDGKILINLTEGKAYIEGYEVVVPYMRTIPLSFSRTTRSVYNEPKSYATGTNKYKLNNTPVAKLNDVVSDVQVAQEITRGTIEGGADFLPNTPVIEIISIKAGGTTYVQGEDFQLITDQIDWSLPGKEPASGSSYLVTYKYKKSNEVGEDVTLVKEGTDYYVQFEDAAVKPVNGSQITVDYDFYLARKDLVMLNKEGQYVILEGNPDIARLAQTPLNEDDDNLILGSVMVMPDSGEVLIVNEWTTRLTQKDLYNLKRRIDDMEYNQAMSDLDNEAAAGENATDLKGIFTDGFIGTTKADVTNSEWNATIDLDTAELTLASETGIVDLEINSGSSENTAAIMGRVFMAPFVEEEAIVQKYATQTMLVNPYAVYKPMLPIKLNPEVDNWVDTTKVTIEKETVKTTTLRRWWYHRGESWAESEKKKWQELGFVDGGESLGWSAGKITSSNTVTDVVLDEAIMYMRSRTVTAEGSNFTPNEDNIKGTFNGMDIILTPLDATLAGTQLGSIRADGKGYFKCKFTVPANVPCGQVPVAFKGPTSEGTAVYKASGRKMVIQETVLTTKVVVNPVDPLAQSFGFEDDTVITSVDLFFASKDEHKAVVVQVRNMVNGFPGTECYNEEIIQPDDIVVSGDSSKPTNVQFSQPVYCKANEQYCICILSDSNLYTMYVAQLGEKDYLTKEYVTAQPYEAGVMFSSSNALTWTAHQTQDLKFTIYKAKYTGKGTIVFKEVEIEAMIRLVLAANSIDYKNAGIEWWFRVSDTDEWALLDTFSEKELSAVARKFQLKCVMNVAYSTSPIIAGDCVNLIYFMEGRTATYVSRMVEMDEDFTSIKTILDLALPSGCTCKVYYKLEDKSASWVEMISPTTVRLGTEWVQYTWSKDSVQAKKFRVKIVLNTTNPLIRPRARKLRCILKY